MNAKHPSLSALDTIAPPPGTTDRAAPALPPAAARVLRNTYALLALTVLFSAAVAATGAALTWPHPGLVATLIGSFGLLYLTHKLSHSGWGLLSVFALTGFMGYTLGPVIAQALSMPGGSQVVTMALGTTAVTFFALSGFVLATRKNFSFLGGFLFAGMVIALVAALGAMFFQIPALALTVSAALVLLSVGLILFETSRIVHGGETNYILATVGLYVSIFNLFASLLSLFGFGGGDE